MEHTGHGHHHDESRNISIAFFLNLFFTVIEIAGGLLTNSVAILSDAIHDLGDSITLGLSWRMEKVAQKKGTPKLTFGYKRYSLLGALVSSLVLLFGSVYILIQAVGRIRDPEPVHTTGMLIIAIVGVLINGAAVLRLRGGHKLNQRVVMLHLLEDALGWIAVLVVSIVLQFYDLPILDPILSICITVFVLFKIYPNIKQTLKIFLQYSPDDIDVQAIKAALKGLEEIVEVHDVHLWSIDGSYNIFSCHLKIVEDLPLSQIEGLKRAAKEMLHDFGIEHATLEFELAGTECRYCEFEEV